MIRLHHFSLQKLFRRNNRSKLLSPLSTTTLMAVFFSIALQFGCASDSFDDVPDTQETASYYLLLIAPTRESALAKCIEAETVALSCTNDAGRQTQYLSAVSSHYRPASTSTVATTLCNSEIDAGVFNSPTIYTYAARQCHFECNRQFWQSQRDSSLCTSSGASTAIIHHGECSPTNWRNICQNNTFKSCLIDCFVNGTDTYFLPQGY